jgi:hypothetical protein
MKRVEQIVQRDAWAAAQAETPTGPYILRFRTPIVQAGETGLYSRKLVVCWPYAPEGSGALPDDATSEAMGTFEDRLCAAWEADFLAVLTAVLTFDGARQWVYYTCDVPECGRRLDEMPQESDPYPIELTTESDPDWSYLRDRVLARIDWQKHQAEWLRAVGAPGPA